VHLEVCRDDVEDDILIGLIVSEIGCVKCLAGGIGCGFTLAEVEEQPVDVEGWPVGCLVVGGITENFVFQFVA